VTRTGLKSKTSIFFQKDRIFISDNISLTWQQNIRKFITTLILLSCIVSEDTCIKAPWVSPGTRTSQPDNPITARTAFRSTVQSLETWKITLERIYKVRITQIICDNKLQWFTRKKDYPARISASVYVLTLFSGIPRAFPRTYRNRHLCIWFQSKT
jgi:hypothetical protein